MKSKQTIALEAIARMFSGIAHEDLNETERKVVEAAAKGLGWTVKYDTFGQIVYKTPDGKITY